MKKIDLKKKSDDEVQIKFLEIGDLPRIRANRFSLSYSNHIEANRSFYDLSLTFCQISKNLKEQTVLEEQVTTIMTWEQIIRLRDLLTRLIKQYEDTNGKIRLQEETNLEKRSQF